jgi:two-component system response regulator AtoC
MGKHILIVDDEESVAFFLKENLAAVDTGYEVEMACSGEEALSRMAIQSFDLVITDLRMPGIGGLALMEQVQSRYPHTRLILMTAYGDAEIEATAYRLGACHYITKPFTIEKLTAVVRKALAESDALERMD